MYPCSFFPYSDTQWLRSHSAITAHVAIKWIQREKARSTEQKLPVGVDMVELYNVWLLIFQRLSMQFSSIGGPQLCRNYECLWHFETRKKEVIKGMFLYFFAV